MGRKLYKVVGTFGDPELPVSLKAFRQGCRELGWPVPKLVEDSDGVLMVRGYWEGGLVYEGDPEFDYQVWLRRGANWYPVLKPVRNERGS